MSESPLEAEVSADTTTFEHFGREWSVPNKRHHSHIRRHKEIVRSEGQVDADDVAAIYLSPEQYDALVALNASEADLYEFAEKIAAALGVGGSGNSQPSSASS